MSDEKLNRPTDKELDAMDKRALRLEIKLRERRITELEAMFKNEAELSNSFRERLIVEASDAHEARRELVESKGYKAGYKDALNRFKKKVADLYESVNGPAPKGKGRGRA